MSEKPLHKFEQLAQRLVEGSFGRLFGGRLNPLEISAEIARAIEDKQKDGLAPNEYTVQLHPADYSYLRVKWPDVATVLTHYVLQISQQLNLELATDPIVELMASPDIARNYAHVHAIHKSDKDGTTEAFVPVKEYDPLIALRAVDAFLIMNGRKHIPLDRPTMTIGRRSDCDVILDDGTVSRRHAQIRWRFGRFVIYDLGSRAGTHVNEQPINEFVLRPGDVIQINDTTLIYGEGLSKTQRIKTKQPSEGVTQAQPRIH